MNPNAWPFLLVGAVLGAVCVTLVAITPDRWDVWIVPIAIAPTVMIVGSMRRRADGERAGVRVPFVLFYGAMVLATAIVAVPFIPESRDSGMIGLALGPLLLGWSLWANRTTGTAPRR